MGENKGNPKGNPHLLEGSQYADKINDSDFPFLSQVSWKKLPGNEHCRRWKRHDHISRAEMHPVENLCSMFSRSGLPLAFFSAENPLPVF